MPFQVCCDYIGGDYRLVFHTLAYMYSVCFLNAAWKDGKPCALIGLRTFCKFCVLLASERHTTLEKRVF